MRAILFASVCCTLCFRCLGPDRHSCIIRPCDGSIRRRHRGRRRDDHEHCHRNTLKQMKTNQAGLYNFSALPPGPYTLAVRAQGFQQVEQHGLVLHVEDRATQDTTLPVGSSVQTVVVQSESTQLNTQSATVGTVVSRDFIANLPLNGRSIQSLITLTPSVVVTPVTSGSPGQFSINGQRPDANYFTVDGVSANVSVGAGASVLAGASGSGVQPSASGGFNNLASIDAIQEFKIQTSTFAPEFGRTPGGQVSIITRSGDQSVSRRRVRVPSQQRPGCE